MPFSNHYLSHHAPAVAIYYGSQDLISWSERLVYASHKHPCFSRVSLTFCFHKFQSFAIAQLYHILNLLSMLFFVFYPYPLVGATFSRYSCRSDFQSRISSLAKPLYKDLTFPLTFRLTHGKLKISYIDRKAAS